MGTTIRADCDRCGTVEVALESSLLEVRPEGDARPVALLVCPSCGRQITQRIGERATRLLAAAGIEITMSKPTPDRTRVSDTSSST